MFALRRFRRFQTNTHITKARGMSTGDLEDLPWKKIHADALKNNERSYIDPATGYTAFTELSHLDRGYCCGNTCRHCPYEYENVGHPERIKEQAREARKKKKQQKANDTQEEEE